MTAPRPDGVRIGAVVLPEHPWPQAREIWRELEQVGLHHAWSFDHHSWRTLHDSPWYDSLSVLSAAAAVTERIGLGTMVSTPNFRHPAVVAKQVMTLDQVSNGRFVFGIGAGAPGGDAGLLGGRDLTPGERADRFAEFVGLSDELLRNRTTTYRGAYFSAVAARMVPGCVQLPRVPFAIAAAGPRGMRLAARHGQWWVTIGDAGRPGERPEEEAWDVLARQVARLEEVCEETGRDFSEIGRLVNVSRIVDFPYSSPERFVDIVGRCQDLGFTDVVVNHPRPNGVFSGNRPDFLRATSAALSAFSR
ncbi:LLM class flavin-dependent oxidoreductase [Streptomyces sp. NBC_00239]|uniref:LLM class flavin-dependent oxidoreductase n=1 Tax=Streptomyces sp. NBC_00239 TaxID=2903640 RepID=UPI002E2E7987|nr:LLM class flavin-dependent oxidoreductase [Streptomyces sp. NBC_00239]